MRGSSSCLEEGSGEARGDDGPTGLATTSIANIDVQYVTAYSMWRILSEEGTMTALLDQPLGTLLEHPTSPTPASDLAEALTVRMARLVYSISAGAARGELAHVLAAASPAAFFRAFVDVLAAHQPHDVHAVLLLKGRAEVLSALEASGGLWRADEAQQQLQVGRASLQAWRRDQKVLALSLPDGSFGYPVAQFAAPPSDLHPPRPYPAIETLLQRAEGRLTAEELFLLMATPQDALVDDPAAPESAWPTAFQCLARGEEERVIALVDFIVRDSDEGAPADVRETATREA